MTVWHARTRRTRKLQLSVSSPFINLSEYLSIYVCTHTRDNFTHTHTNCLQVAIKTHSFTHTQLPSRIHVMLVAANV